MFEGGESFEKDSDPRELTFDAEDGGIVNLLVQVSVVCLAHEHRALMLLSDVNL